MRHALWVLLPFFVVPVIGEPTAGPAVGKEVSASPGEPIVWDIRTYREEVKERRHVGELKEALTVGSVVLPVGTLLEYRPPMPKAQSPFWPGEASVELPLFCSREHFDGSDLRLTKYLCFQDSKKTGKFDRLFVKGYPRPSRMMAVPYQLVEKDIVVEYSPERSFRREILYEGAGGGVLRLAYREFVSDLARPAFTQEATFDLSKEGTTRLRFKGAEIEVLEAGNLGIRYRILAPLTISGAPSSPP